MKRFVVMKENDMVATALTNLKKHEVANIFTPDNNHIKDLQALEDIPYGNKIALCDLKSGQKIVKCGGIIGQCTEPIKTGELVHIHNVKSLIADIPVSFKKEIMRQMNICSKEGN
ncbi:MAG: UxaA family hydrolase [Desulfobacterales bacterium]|nr:UxaA family hydrolase [Desulfobacterales bacterium]MCP4163402.1 UxaA family hydrolase [Deltaproteobacteria bacterium]